MGSYVRNLLFSFLNDLGGSNVMGVLYCIMENYTKVYDWSSQVIGWHHLIRVISL